VSNPSLCALLSKWLGTEAWIRNADLLTGLRDHVDNTSFRHEWKMVMFLGFSNEFSLDQEN
jgi:starch phosphorylase